MIDEFAAAIMAITVRVRGQLLKLEIPWPRTCITVQAHRVFNPVEEKRQENEQSSQKKDSWA